MINTEAYFTRFSADQISGISIPERMNFPFYYDPHPLALVAAEMVQHYLSGSVPWEHNFGLGQERDDYVIGKMFGVLVVKNTHGELGFLSGFSGKLAEKSLIPGFVPPVFDRLQEESYFLKKEKEIMSLSEDLIQIENLPQLKELQDIYQSALQLRDDTLSRARKTVSILKKNRQSIRREVQAAATSDEYEQVRMQHERESHEMRRALKEIKGELDLWVEQIKAQLDPIETLRSTLKTSRKEQSRHLQQYLFEQYKFLNKEGTTATLADIFNDSPPSGAGDCAAPKLFQYAFQQGYEPVCLAEFWWGASPPSEVRVHQQYYPSCRGKCEPILGFMLQGLDVDPNPINLGVPLGEIKILHEDDDLVIISKPAELLSVPGKVESDSVYSRMKKRYPAATGPLIVHRLDMSTSGIMLIPLTDQAYKNLQQQFIKRTIKKRYSAILEGILEEEEGTINLPLRVDLNDRPRQLVCYEHGKLAKTQWQRINQHSENQTLVHFFPVTGRTHQLRVHAAHHRGLCMPILGDDLYGNKADRLHLHAEEISFLHPSTQEEITIIDVAEWS